VLVAEQEELSGVR